MSRQSKPEKRRKTKQAKMLEYLLYVLEGDCTIYAPIVAKYQGHSNRLPATLRWRQPSADTLRAPFVHSLALRMKGAGDVGTIPKIAGHEFYKTSPNGRFIIGFTILVGYYVIWMAYLVGFFHEIVMGCYGMSLRMADFPGLASWRLKCRWDHHRTEWGMLRKKPRLIGEKLIRSIQ